MNLIETAGVRIDGVYACLPKTCEDNLARCTRLYGDGKKARDVVAATGIRTRRIAAAGVSSLDLCVTAAERLLVEADVPRAEIGGVIAVTFTPERAMPCNACQAQARLGLSQDVVAFDIGLACSGYGYGLYVASLLAKSTGKRILLLDGDVQTPVTRADDAATVPVLADAGTATLLTPDDAAERWQFAFLSQGEGGEALTCPRAGTIAMDGFAVFRFVALEVSKLIRSFMSEASVTADAVDAFVPHQANVYMIRQLAKTLGLPEDKLWVSGDEVGNSASATVPVTIARNARGGERLLVSGFGGGLSASVARIRLSSGCRLSCFDAAR